MSSEIAAPPPPPQTPQHEQQADDDEDLYGPVTKAASKEAERDEKRKEEEIQHAQSPLSVREKMNIETAQVLAAAASSSSPQQQFKGKKKRQSNNKKQQQKPLPPSTPPRGKMSVAARARVAADSKNNNNNKTKKNNNNSKQKPLSNAPPSSGNRGITRGKYSAAEAKRLADAWGKDDTSEEGYYDYEDDDGSSYYDDEGEDNGPPYYSNDNPTEEEMFHYQHHRVSAYSNRYGRGHGGGSPSRGSNNDHHNNMNHHHNNMNHHHHSNNNNKNQGNNSGGIFSLASNWLQNQREKLHQLELERKVEEQRRKLVEEGRKQREAEAEKRRDRGYAISPPGSPTKRQSAVAASAIAGDEVATSSLVYMNGCVCTSPSQEEPQLDTVNSDVSSSLFICGFGGIGNYALSLDDASDYSGVARIDSSGNIVEMMPSQDLDDEEDDDDEEGDYMTVRTPKITMTGKGMSVDVEIPEDNITRSDSMDPRHIDIKIVPEPCRDDNDNSIAPFILLQPQMKALLESGGLPQSLNYCKWKRLYSLSRDGDSFETFLRMVEGHNRTVLVVKTTAGRLFGGYADTRWEARHKNRQADGFYGSAQACLFRFPRCGETTTTSSKEDDNEVVIYKWTGANRYIQLCDAYKRAVAFGGGGDDGDFGLCIEDDFRRGTTGHCSTFENEALCEEGYFDVVDLEVWGFTLDF
ncbi:TLD domain-containing protein [Skeletonema marinoi]|uniref:Oxidation resistance protein 1 n=2 Tax=Skeletonema marinoi TaxID=267567 RepID=A0AAD9DCW1_9STRA|nr:TLD domain-containing protein [Skeletonema marinoi]